MGKKIKRDGILFTPELSECEKGFWTNTEDNTTGCRCKRPEPPPEFNQAAHETAFEKIVEKANRDGKDLSECLSSYLQHRFRKS